VQHIATAAAINIDRIGVWLFCNDAELEKNQQIKACSA